MTIMTIFVKYNSRVHFFFATVCDFFFGSLRTTLTIKVRCNQEHTKNRNSLGFFFTNLSSIVIGRNMNHQEGMMRVSIRFIEFD